MFTVTLSGSTTTQATDVQFETMGDAEAVDDYGTPTGRLSFPPGNTTGRAGTLQIPAGQSSGTITYPILTDMLSEGDEDLEMELVGLSFGARSASIPEARRTATTTILDEDSLNVSIKGTPSVTEGTVATFTIELSTASDESVSADWATPQAGTHWTRAKQRSRTWTTRLLPARWQSPREAPR